MESLPKTLVGWLILVSVAIVFGIFGWLICRGM
jgi:hypothetical protein